jgi:hypothetical protein
MKITIEGTREEIADALRRLAAPEDIKPILAPKRARIDPVVMPFIPYEPSRTTDPPTVKTFFWSVVHPDTGEYTGVHCGGTVS